MKQTWYSGNRVKKARRVIQWWRLRSAFFRYSKNLMVLSALSVCLFIFSSLHLSLLLHSPTSYCLLLPLLFLPLSKCSCPQASPAASSVYTSASFLKSVGLASASAASASAVKDPYEFKSSPDTEEDPRTEVSPFFISYLQKILISPRPQ